MKNLITLMLTICCLTQLYAQSPEAGDYRSKVSGDWNTASNWESYSTSSGWSEATSKPGSSRNVTIQEGTTITLSSTNTCKNLTIENGGILDATASSSIRVGGVTGMDAVLQNDGVLGNTTLNSLLIVEVPTTAASLTIQGTGITQVARLRFLGSNTQPASTLTINQNVTIVAENSAAFSAFINSGNKTTDNYTITINAGKTVKLLNPDTYFHSSSTATTVTGGNYTYNILGTLDLSQTTVNANIIPNSHNSLSGVTLNISGLVKLGTGLNLVNSSPSEDNNGSVVINVNNGGIIDATKTTTLTTGDNYFRLAGSGTVKRSVGNTDVSFPVGLHSASSANPVTLNNSGTETNFSVNLLGSFDVLPSSTQIVNRQWNVQADDAGANINLKLNWKTDEQGTGFNSSESISLIRLNGSTWGSAGVSSITGPDASGFYQAETSGIETFGAFSLQNTSTLPLNFTAFNAALKNTGFSPEVLLTWTTQNEINTKSFVIERGTDALNFNPIGSISAKNVSGTNNYSFTDNTPLNGEAYYRLKQLDNDGQFTYSDIRSITNTGNLSLTVYPNPVTKSINLTHQSAEKNTLIKITSLNGQLVTSYPVQYGSTGTLIDASSFLPGIYTLIFENGNSRTIKKFIKQ